jgi:Outer membrane protein beta-barrel domain
MRKLLLLAAVTLCASAAHADNGMLYIGAGLTNDNLRDIAATNSDLNSTSWKVWAGFRPISMFAVEADYIDLGSQSISSTSFDSAVSTHLSYKAFAAYGVGYVPIPVPYLDVFGKVGLARWTSSGSSVVGSDVLGGSGIFSLSDNGTQFAWGVGGQVHFGNFGGRLEYENFSIRNTSGANLISLSAFLNLF